ncbi:glycine zipper 2TM domain-containing protein [Azospirillum doebereinerae]
MSRFGMFCLLAAVAGGLAGCTSDYSPNTYASNAVQQANKAEPGVVAGYRQVSISANGTVGAVTGGAAGGILGAQVGSGGFNSALGTVGGTAIGTIIGTTMEHLTGDTTGWEYIVRKPNGELLSLTQREPQPLPIGQKVLVITGSQARIIPDYSVPADAPAPAAPAAPAPEKPKAEIKAEPLEAPPASAPAQPSGAAPEAAPAASGPVRLAPAAAAALAPLVPLPPSGDAVRIME